MNLTSLGVNSGGRDYYGSNVYAGTNFDIGAFEASSLSGSSGDDTYLMRIGPTGAIEVFINTANRRADGRLRQRRLHELLDRRQRRRRHDDARSLRRNPLPTGGASFNGGAQNITDELIVTGIDGQRHGRRRIVEHHPRRQRPALFLYRRRRCHRDYRQRQRHAALHEPNAASISSAGPAVTR
jgi:hypothetical protein